MYRIIGADGRQYGPVSAEQLQQWIAEGRANAQTQTFAEGAAEWKPLGALPEFAGRFAPQTPPTISPPFPGPGPEDKLLRDGRVDFWHFGIFLLLQIPVRPAGHHFLARRPFANQPASGILRRPWTCHCRTRPFHFEPVVGVLLVLIFALATGNFHFNWGFHRF